MKRVSWGKLPVLLMGLVMMHSSMAADGTLPSTSDLDTLLAGLAAGVLAVGLMLRRLKR
ncbi:hypothetical protein KAK06_13365 [Ideonella sp. 4Y11]|uniref:LPXTG cell wall anchor domain-containing protein n=1 Tax=Ideonella aquatica TaxID=2824119 RepID=A0A941BGL1_9BURK|nr:hypothetical protein [Ideonella aquatica]MBQ0959936.1 hypothetical protein [Ideonella aquatica]